MQIEKTYSLDNFLKDRSDRIKEVEMSLRLCKNIYESLCNVSRPLLNDDSYIDGSIYQLFAYMQRILMHFIFNNFHTIIGSCKRGVLQSWKNFNLDDKVILGLNSVKDKYAASRDSYVSHFPDIDKLTNISEIMLVIKFEDVEKDITFIKYALNLIRKQNKIPELIDVYDVSKEYPVIGMQELFQLLVSMKNS